MTKPKGTAGSADKVELPKKTWSLAKLTEFCQEKERRMARDAWLIGYACLIVEKEQKANGEFMAWIENTFGQGRYKTINRYMRLAEEVKLEHLGGATLVEAYRALGMVKPANREQPERGDQAPLARPTAGRQPSAHKGKAPTPPPPLQRGDGVGPSIGHAVDLMRLLAADLAELQGMKPADLKPMLASADLAALRHAVNDVRAGLSWLFLKLSKNEGRKRRAA